MKCLSVLLLIGFLYGSFGFDYDATPMEDPLQPIWKRLESLSGDIRNGFQQQMQNFIQQTQQNIETKFQSLKSEMNSRTGAMGANIDTNSLANEVKNTVSAWMENFYQETMKGDNEGAIMKAEGSIKVRIDALENKLIEHINIKFASLTGGRDTTSLNQANISSSSDTPDVLSHITTKLTDIENDISQQLSDLASSMTSSSSTLSSINTHVRKITEELSDSLAASESGSSGTSTTTSSESGSSQSCTALVTKVTEFMNGTQLTTEFLEQQERRWKEMQSVIAEVRETPSYLPRDCSDIHWLHHEATSGVYQIYPTIDRKVSVMVWCDMAENRDKSDGGWTVILRRRETDFGHVDFNRTWKEYAAGFGDPAEGEWWFSLSFLHALTYRQPYHVRFIMRDIEDGIFLAEYRTFRVEDDAHNFRLIVDGFSGNVSLDAFKSKHHLRDFSTLDKDNDNWPAGACAVSNNGGWWYNACHYTTLTAPFPTGPDREARTIRWHNKDKWLVLDDVTMKIRPVDYGERFNVHIYNEGQ